MKYFYILAVVLIFCFHARANVSDTIHVSHYNITIDTVDFSGHAIRGVTELTVHSKMNGVNNITLGLYFLQIDSITSANIPLAYSYNDTLISITPPTTLNQNDSVILRISYHGVPKTDATFGGFYFNSTDYAFNIGVGFSVDPHTFGKAWFPCVDEFTDRSTYEFHITTGHTYKAFCNGALISSITNPDSTITWNWQLDETIPTYLAAIAVAPFYTIRRTYEGIPVELGVFPSDSVNTLKTFVHLDSALMNDITSYGPYPWNKVGYVMVPFNSGAMEHATSIHVGKAFINGTLTYEANIMAHELSHMWWGDKVTCETEQDMWLNEGWATFNENHFTEFVYGQAAYEANRRSLHRQVVQYAHRRDYGYYALNNIPHAYTYGYSVYQKGSDVVHSLRRFMGDSAFFQACKYHLNQCAFNTSNSGQLRDNFSASSGNNLTDYFSTIVMMQGFPHVSVDSFSVSPNASNYDVTVYLREKMEGNPNVFSLPVELTFDNGTDKTTKVAIVNAATNVLTFTIPFIPLWVAIDREDKLSDAVVDYEMQVTDTGTYSFPETYSSIHVEDAGSDTSTIRMINHYVPPDPFINPYPGVRLSDFHYFSVEGIISAGFQAQGIFGYNGAANYSTGYLDNTLLMGSAREDSLLIFYRPNSGEDWQKVNGYTINYQGAHLDKIGSITVDTLKIGEYVLGVYDSRVNVEEAPADNIKYMTVSPNPVNGNCLIAFHLPSAIKGKIEIFDDIGRLAYSTVVYSHQDAIDWDTFGVKPGIYFVQLSTEEKIMAQEKVVVQKR